MNSIAKTFFKIFLSLLLGGAILYWMYRGFDFKSVQQSLLHEMNWTWMLLSMPFGILAQTFRGWRWKQTLEPVGEKSRTSVRINSIFLSYASSLIIPRSGEFLRCGILKHYDGVNVSKSLGTVVTERAIDTLLLIIIALITVFSQIPIFSTFFNQTGTSLSAFFRKFSTTGYIFTAICGIAVIILLSLLIRKLSVFQQVKGMLNNLWQGIVSIKHVQNIPLFVFFTTGIWLSYFLHYYLTFFCFPATSQLGASCALVSFVVGTIAVIVPTPNGAGPWHFAVKTMLILYGINETDALNFVLIVHSLQTLLVILLGIAAWILLNLTKRKLY